MRRVWEFIIGIVAVAAAIAIAVYASTNYAHDVSVVSLPVPRADIAPYTLLTTDQFTWKEFPRGLGAGYAGSIHELAGQIAVGRIPAGLPVPQTLLSSLAAWRIAPTGMKTLSIPVTAANAVAGSLQPGERIDVFRLIPPQSGGTDANGLPVITPAKVELVVGRALVVDVTGDEGQHAQNDSTSLGIASSSAAVPVRILMLALSPDDTTAVLQLMAETHANTLMWIALSEVQ